MLTAAPTMKQKDMEFVMIACTTQQGICVNFARKPSTKTQLYHRVPPILWVIKYLYFDDNHSAYCMYPVNSNVCHEACRIIYTNAIILSPDLEYFEQW